MCMPKNPFVQHEIPWHAEVPHQLATVRKGDRPRSGGCSFLRPCTRWPGSAPRRWSQRRIQLAVVRGGRQVFFRHEVPLIWVRNSRFLARSDATRRLDFRKQLRIHRTITSFWHPARPTTSQRAARATSQSTPVLIFESNPAPTAATLLPLQERARAQTISEARHRQVQLRKKKT